MSETPKNRLSGAQAFGLALKRLRVRADLTQEQAAEKAGVATQSWRRYEWGERDLSLDKWMGLAEAIGFTGDDLQLERAAIGDGPALNTARMSSVLDAARGGTMVSFPRAFANPTPELQFLTVRDRVQAGAWLAADDLAQDEPRTYPAVRDPRYPGARQWLSEVVGDSVNQLGIFSGDFVQIVDAIDIRYHPRTGDIVEVQRNRPSGERELTLKQVVVNDDKVELWPRSTNPRWSEPLEILVGADLGLDAEEFGAEVRIRGLVLQSIRRF